MSEDIHTRLTCRNWFFGVQTSFTPMKVNCRLIKYSILLTENTSYRKLVGKLLYLTITRPDIAYSVQQLSQFLDCPTTDHIVATHKVLRYLKGSIGQGLFYSATARKRLQAYSNADWGTYLDICKFITRYWGTYLDIEHWHQLFLKCSG